MLRDCGPNRYKTLTIPVAPALQMTSIDTIQDKKLMHRTRNLNLQDTHAHSHTDADPFVSAEMKRPYDFPW